MESVPLFAQTEQTAHGLFNALASHAGNAAIFLDVPQPNKSAVALAGQYGMTPVFETVRMYTKGDPGLPLAQIFGITTFELG